MADTAGVEVRPAALADVGGLVDVVNHAYEHERWLIPGPRTTPAELAAEIRAPRSVVLVAWRDARPAGTVRLRPIASSEADLGMLAVDPALHGRGIGRRLVEAAERWGREAGFRALRLECGLELGLVPYYRALGYGIVGQQVGTHLDSFRPFTMVTMRKDLG